MRIIRLIIILLLVLSSCTTSGSLLNKNKHVSASLYGKVYDGDNQPCASVDVTLIDEKSKKRTTATDVTGSFYFTDLEFHEYHIIIGKDKYKTEESTIQITNKSQNVYLKILSFAQLTEMGEKALEEEDYDKAAGYIDDVLLLDPDNIVALYLNAVKQWRQKEYILSMESLEKLEIRLNGKNKEAVLKLKELVQKAAENSSEN